jgi:hypothetical protein
MHNHSTRQAYTSRRYVLATLQRMMLRVLHLSCSCRSLSGKRKKTRKVFPAGILSFSRYEQDDLTGCRALLEEGLASAPDASIAHACLAFKEDRFEDSLKELSEAKNQLGYAADISYNMALCYYKLGSLTFDFSIVF